MLVIPANFICAGFSWLLQQPRTILMKCLWMGFMFFILSQITSVCKQFVSDLREVSTLFICSSFKNSFVFTSYSLVNCWLGDCHIYFLKEDLISVSKNSFRPSSWRVLPLFFTDSSFLSLSSLSTSYWLNTSTLTQKYFTKFV